MQELEEVETAARALGIETITLKIREAANIASAFESLKGRAQALYVVGEPLTSANRVRINSFALAARLPTMVLGREILETGCLSPMDRTSLAYTDAPATTSTKSCAAESGRKFRSSSRPNLISLSI